MSRRYDNNTLSPEQQRFQLELLQTIAAFWPKRPSYAQLGREFGMSRQWAHKHLKRLRDAGYLEGNEPGVPEWGARLTHNGKRLLERLLGAELKH